MFFLCVCVCGSVMQEAPPLARRTRSKATGNIRNRASFQNKLSHPGGTQCCKAEASTCGSQALSRLVKHDIYWKEMVKLSSERPSHVKKKTKTDMTLKRLDSVILDDSRFGGRRRPPVCREWCREERVPSQHQDVNHCWDLCLCLGGRWSRTSRLYRPEPAPNTSLP